MSVAADRILIHRMTVVGFGSVVLAALVIDSGSVAGSDFDSVAESCFPVEFDSGFVAASVPGAAGGSVPGNPVDLSSRSQSIEDVVATGFASVATLRLAVDPGGASPWSALVAAIAYVSVLTHQPSHYSEVRLPTAMHGLPRIHAGWQPFRARFFLVPPWQPVRLRAGWQTLAPGRAGFQSERLAGVACLR